MPQFFLGGLFTSVRESVVDTFSRNNTPSLDRATDGSLWQTIRSGLGIENNRAHAINQEQYPISAVDMPSSNVSISLTGVTQGAGAAIWVQSSDDWYVATIDQTPRNVPESNATVSANYSYGAAFNSSTGTEFAPFYSATFNSAAWNTTYGYNRSITYTNGFKNATGNYSYTAWNTFFFRYSYAVSYRYFYFGKVSGSAWGFYNVSGWARSGNSFTANASYTYKVAYSTKVTTDTEWSYTVYVPPSFAGNTFAGNYGYLVTIPGYQYTAFAPYTYTVTVPAQVVYDQKVSIRQSIAGNIQLLQSWLVSSSQVIRSLLVRTNGEQITVKPYSDTNLVSQIGEDLVYTATGAEITPKFGITISPSSYGQGTTAATTISINT
jgi:hypothetical protein